MDKMYYVVVNGKMRPLNWSMEVMFNTADKFGSVTDALNAITTETRESVAAIRWLLVQLVNDAELLRRTEGYEHDPLLTEEDIIIDRPGKYQMYKEAILKAFDIGYEREVEDPKAEIDLGLAELNSKKEKAGE
ncbi:MAG: hypothetical protein J6N19_10010 [Clostridium sp.]|nr:hypothetical protein [Clostridium sp.]